MPARTRKVTTKDRDTRRCELCACGDRIKSGEICGVGTQPSFLLVNFLGMSRHGGSCAGQRTAALLNAATGGHNSSEESGSCSRPCAVLCRRQCIHGVRCSYAAQEKLLSYAVRPLTVYLIPRQVRDGAAVMTCLKRALKVANAAQQQLAMSAKRTGLSEPVRLYVDILNQYLFFFDQGVPNITVSVLQVRSQLHIAVMIGTPIPRQACAT